MMVSYVAVTGAAVLIIEVVLLTVVAPALRAADQRVKGAQAERAAARARADASNDASSLGLLLGKLTVGDPKAGDAQLLRDAAQHAGPLSLPASPNGIDLEALADLDGTIAVSSLPSTFPAGSRLPGRWARDGSGTTTLNGDPAVWVTLPVRVFSMASTVDSRPIGVLYVRVGAGDASGSAPSGDSSTTQLLLPGLLILGLLVPIGVLFGLLTTWSPIRRVQGLDKVITAVAHGDLDARIPVKGGDELGHLEEGFNNMAHQLQTASRRERETAAVEARRVERNRLARELHDSVSQDLFSINLFVGGLREALPRDSSLQKQVDAMERTIDRTMLEMRALLLELRPIALEGAGLVPALRELCMTYETRLGAQVISRNSLEAATDHVLAAVLRLRHEGLLAALQERLGQLERAVRLRVRPGRQPVLPHAGGELPHLRHVGGGQRLSPLTWGSLASTDAQAWCAEAGGSAG